MTSWCQGNSAFHAARPTLGFRSTVTNKTCLLSLPAAGRLKKLVLRIRSAAPVCLFFCPHWKENVLCICNPQMENVCINRYCDNASCNIDWLTVDWYIRAYYLIIFINQFNSLWIYQNSESTTQMSRVRWMGMKGHIILLHLLCHHVSLRRNCELFSYSTALSRKSDRSLHICSLMLVSGKINSNLIPEEVWLITTACRQEFNLSSVRWAAMLLPKSW